MRKRSLVDNAADPVQLRRADMTIRQRRESELADLRSVMTTHSGRAFLWKTIMTCSAYDSVAREGPGLVLYHSGRQDIGHHLINEAIEAGSDLFLLMQKEAFDSDRKADEIAEAQATPSVNDKAQTVDDSEDAPS